MNLSKEELQSSSPESHQLVVEFEYEYQHRRASMTKNVRLHFTMATEKEAKDWAEGLQYLRTYIGCK